MSDNDKNVLLEALEKRWNDFQLRFTQYRSEASEESVHDLRVATRRLLSILELIRGVVPSPRLQNLRNYFKDQLNSYDELHDTQVMMVEIAEVLEEFPEAELFLIVLEKREKRLMHKAEKVADQVKIESLKKKVVSIHQDVETLTEDAFGLNEQVLCAVDDAYSLVLNRVEALKRNQVATIHRVRIAMKKFRYLIEIVSPILTDFPKETMEFIHEFQNIMGEIQDVEILLGNLDQYYRDHKQLVPTTVKNYFEKVHSEDIETFYQNVTCIQTFWRQHSDLSFPWESSSTLAKADCNSETSVLDGTRSKRQKKAQSDQPN